MTLGKLEITPDVGENVEEQAALAAATAELDSLSDWVIRYRKMKELEREVAEKVREARDMIVGHLKDRGAEFGTVGGEMVVRRRTVVTRRIDTTALKAKEPELAERFTKESVADRLELIEP